MNNQAWQPLPGRMQAVVCHKPEDYRLEEVDVPVPGPGEVVIKVHSAGICASDIACYVGTPGYWSTGDIKGYVQPPVVPGHEFVGHVAALGEGAGERYGLKIGDTAVSEQVTPCWSCRFCRGGNYHMCIIPEIYGFRRKAQGAMAEYMKFPGNAINHRIPGTVPIDHAVYVEPLACAIHAVQRADIQFGDVAVIAARPAYSNGGAKPSAWNARPGLPDCRRIPRRASCARCGFGSTSPKPSGGCSGGSTCRISAHSSSVPLPPPTTRWPPE